jgi:YD repeat-containing protein
MTSVEDADNNKTVYVYDDLNRVIEVKLPEDNSTYYTHIQIPE